jgi:hypothetical protein
LSLPYFKNKIRPLAIAVNNAPCCDAYRLQYTDVFLMDAFGKSVIAALIFQLLLGD